MPCDTPPPLSPVNDEINDGNDEDLDDAMYEIIEDVDDLIVDNDDDDDEGMLGDDSVVTFDGHKQSVFCCSFDKTDQYVVTGGQDDTAYVWSVPNKLIKFECTGHSDSVIAASFSADSKYVATADMNGLVQVWDVDEAAVVWNFETSEIAWLQWLKGGNILIAGSVDGNCWKWSIPDGDTSVLANPAAACCTGCISHNDEKLATGYSDGSLKFWNVSSNALLATLSGSTGHKEAIINIKYNADDSLILTASEDGTAKVIKASDFKVLWTITGCDSNLHQHENVSVEDVEFCHSLPYIAIGTNCGIISMWDLNTKTRRAYIETKNSIIKIVADKLAPVFYAAIGDGTLQAHDARSGDAVKYWHGHGAAILDLSLSSDCSLLLTASDDTTSKIFQRGIF